MFVSAVLVLAESLKKMLLIAAFLMALNDFYMRMTYAVRVHCAITTFGLLVSFM